MILIYIVLCIGCNEKKVGETIVKVSTEESQISIDNFPHGGTGIEGFTEVTYPDGFSTQKIDEIIYDYVTSKTFENNEVKVRFRYTGEDHYGKDTVGKWISIGKIYIYDSKKYADFHRWAGVYGLEELFRSYKKGIDSISIRKEIKDDILKQLAETPKEPDLNNSSAGNKLDTDRGLHLLKLGTSMQEIESFADLSKSEDDGGASYSIDNLSDFNLFGSEIYKIRLFAIDDRLAELRIQLMPYDISETAITENRERIFHSYENLYGRWEHRTITDTEKSFGVNSKQVIRGNRTMLERFSIEVIDNKDGRLMKPGDLYIYTDISSDRSVGEDE